MIKAKRKFLGLVLESGATLYWLLGLVIVVWGLSGCAIVCLVAVDPNEGWATRGQFGDMFGVVNSLFSGLAFGGIFYTFLLQQEEIKNQSVQLDEQRNTIILQRFETSFFNLVSMYNDIVGGMDIKSHKKPFDVIYAGRDCFRHFYKEYTRISEADIERRFMDTQSGNLKPADETKKLAIDFANQQTIEAYMDSFKSFLYIYESDLGHYFRFIRMLLNFIESANIENKGEYVKMLTEQLSSNELLLLFYYALSDEKLKSLFLKYSIIANVRRNELLNPSHWDLYQV